MWRIGHKVCGSLVIITVLAVSLLNCGGSGPDRSSSLDVIVRGARLIDGSGNPWFYGDIGIRGDSIVEVGDLRGRSAGAVIEAGGLAVSPGFIDMHTHCDDGLGKPESRADINYLTQGVTTVVTGNCGASPIEIGKTAAAWSKAGIGTNAVMLIGLGSVREKVMGDAVRPPAAGEMADMKELVTRAMREGAFGISTGLQYHPGKYATTGEIIEIAAAAAPFGGIYSTHMRSEEENLIPAVDEAISIGLASGLRVEVSHLKSSGRPNWGRLKEAVGHIDAARAKGLEITADIYPYDRSATATLDEIFNIPDDLEPLADLQKKTEDVDLAPASLRELADRFSVELARALADPSTRRRIEEPTLKGVVGKTNWVAKGGWDNFTIMSSRTKPAYVGRMFRDLARETGRSEFDIAADLYVDEGRDLLICLSTMSEDDVRTGLVQPWAMIGSDGSALDPAAGGSVHPRNYGTFTRVLGEYVRNTGLLRLEEAVRKMTSLPAQQLRLNDRGLIRPGMKADLVIFDPEKVSDKATFLEPRRYSEGIEYVLVNGRLVMEHGVYNGVLNGRVLKPSGH